MEYAVDGGEPASTTVTVGDPAVLADLPVGAEVQLRETDLPALASGGWADPAWSVDGEPLTPDADGWVTVTADADQVALDLVNTVVPEEPGTPGTPTEPTLPGTGTNGVPVLVAVAAGLLALGLLLRHRARRTD